MCSVPLNCKQLLCLNRNLFIVSFNRGHQPAEQRGEEARDGNQHVEGGHSNLLQKTGTQVFYVCTAGYQVRNESSPAVSVLQSDLEDSQEKNRSLQVILDNSYK